MERLDLAKSSYETAVQQDPTFYEAYLRLGAIYQAENNPISLEYYTTAYQLQPKNPEVLYSLAYANQSFNKIESAKKLYHKMVERESSTFYVSRGLFQLAYLKQFYENDLDSAIYYYSSAIQTDGLYVEAFHNRGVCYDDKGDFTNALKNYSSALKINPKFELSRTAADEYNNNL
jgi:tetratricopeptide (TPR) repeat protein